jgi:tetratricopeptide (TPR) repeat protein
MLNACSSQKDTATSRAMQNLTSRYNYIYNANGILNAYIAELQETHSDNFSEVLPVYINPTAFNPAAADPIIPTVDRKELDEIISKAQLLIADKSYSNYIDDSYMLLGKAYFYKGNYFIAAEYFSYVAHTYKTDKKVLLQAMNWKTRSYMQLSNLKAAAATTDTLETLLDSTKHNRAEPLATLAQMSIDLNRNKEAIPYLQAAISSGSTKQNKIRWTYILGQLHESQNDLESALKCYKKVQSSNAGFELYFNANLSRIKLASRQQGKVKSRRQEMLSLLKDDKNSEFLDQVYYNIANVYAEEQDYTAASTYYNRSIQSSTKNQYQKGMSYLKLADLNFNQFRNYLKAKAYYDSTVSTLPKYYPGYAQIVIKNKNLQYLSDRYKQIALQDSLQVFARVAESDRLPRIQRFYLASQSINAVPRSSQSSTSNQVRGNGTFYFNNQNAVALGLLDFRRKWGNRKQEDNWRQSVRTSGQTNTQKTLTANVAGIPTDPNQSLASSSLNDSAIQNLISALPTTPTAVQASNEKIINAYFEIASFYQQQLSDDAEAIRVYKLLLKRFPNNNYLPAINYSLYLAYKEKQPKVAAEYKNTVLSKFGNSVYAKTILDPSFSVKQSESDQVLELKYNELFTTYQSKEFPKVIQAANQLASNYRENYLLAQSDYLKAIAIGRTQNVDSLIAAFTTIQAKFPGDKLIVPLVDSQLAYINAHLSDFKKRRIALADFDPNELPFSTRSTTQPVNAARAPKTEATQTKQANQIIQPVNAAAAIPEKAPSSVATPPVQTKNPELTVGRSNSIFSVGSVSNTYYFVIDVADASLTLSSSRFGIGQFNRGNYARSNFRHQLVEFDDDQLIYVGNFSSFDDVKQYADGIVPQLKKIMKMPESKYVAFIISKENFEKLKSKALVNQYLEFFKSNH